MQPTRLVRPGPARSAVGLILASVVLLVPGAVHAQATIPLESMEDPLTGVATVVPEGWTDLGQGIHARRPDASDRVLLAVQAAPMPAASVWTGLLPQLGLDEVPDAIGTRTTAALDWTLYAIDAPAPGGALHVDLALAEQAGTTVLVLLQSTADDAGALREAVFLPAIDRLRLLAPEPTPDVATLPYDVVEVTFPGGSEGVTLAGTLTLPRDAGPHPAVLLLSGSGPQDRDESLRPLSAIKPFALLADALTRVGVAVLRVDDRGTGASTGDFATATLGDLTADARAAFEALVARPEVDPGRTGLLGHSEGGIYIASLIEQGLPIAFAIGLAAPATNGVDLMVAQNGAIARTSGADAAGVERAETFARALYEATLAGDEAAARLAVETYFGDLWDRQPPDAQAALGERGAFVADQVDRQLAAVGGPWFTELLRSDAGIGWGMARIPVLGVFGGKDVQVLADQNAPLMEVQLAGSDPSSRVVTLPDANHLFQAAVTGGLAEYGTLASTFTPDLLPLVTAWVAEQVGLPAPEAAPSPAG